MINMIKMFEEYNNKWRSISRSESLEFGKSYSDFTEAEYNSIKSIFDNNEYYSTDNLFNSGLSKKSDFFKNSVLGVAIRVDINYSDTSFIISKYEDEWYIINYKYEYYYLCDQMDGLLECLEYLISDIGNQVI